MHDCPYCPKFFPSGKALGGHIMRVHANAPDQGHAKRAALAEEDLGRQQSFSPYTVGNRMYLYCPECLCKLSMGVETAQAGGVTPCSKCHILVNQWGETFPSNQAQPWTPRFAARGQRSVE